MGLRIELTNPGRSYFPGDSVEGRVVVQNTEPDKITQIKIVLQGKGRVGWEELKSKHIIIRYSAEENYVGYANFLDSGYRDGEIPKILGKGRHTYPFNFRLPKHLPSSFTSKTGQVLYELTAEIRRSLMIETVRARLNFTVNGIYDLDLEPEASKPQQCAGQLGPNRVGCRTGNINFMLRLLNKSGFVQGELIHFQAEVKNQSNQKVSWMGASLIQVVNAYGNEKCKNYFNRPVAKWLTPVKTSTTVISNIQGTGVEKGVCETWTDSLTIPAVPPTGLGGNCRIIELHYFLRFEMKISGLSKTFVKSIPVFIGTHSLRSSVDTQEQYIPTAPMEAPRYSESERPIRSDCVPVGPQQPLLLSQSSQVPPEIRHNLGDSGLPSILLTPAPSYSTLYLNAESHNPPSYMESGYYELVLDDYYPDLPPPSYAEAVGAEYFPRV